MLVEVAYASKTEQVVLTLQVAASCTAEQAIRQSGILTHFPEINLAEQTVGIFSKRAKLTDLLHPGDRVEIYRPLEVDPKAARRLRASRKSVGCD